MRKRKERQDLNDNRTLTRIALLICAIVSAEVTGLLKPVPLFVSLGCRGTGRSSGHGPYYNDQTARCVSVKGIPRIRSSSVQNGSVKLTQLSPEEHQVVLRLLAPSDALAVYPPLRRIWRRRTGSAWVRYYDSVGKHVRDYLDRPSTLPTMGSVEFVVQRSDTTGGPGGGIF